MTTTLERDSLYGFTELCDDSVLDIDGGNWGVVGGMGQAAFGAGVMLVGVVAMGASANFAVKSAASVPVTGGAGVVGTAVGLAGVYGGFRMAQTGWNIGMAGADRVVW